MGDTTPRRLTTDELDRLDRAASNMPGYVQHLVAWYLPGVWQIIATVPHLLAEVRAHRAEDGLVENEPRPAKEAADV